MIVKLFGITKDIIGSNTLTVEASEKLSTAGELKTWLRSRYPALQNLQSLVIAVDAEYAGDADCIGINSEVALIPPVSGG